MTESSLVTGVACSRAAGGHIGAAVRANHLPEPPLTAATMAGGFHRRQQATFIQSVIAGMGKPKVKQNEEVGI